MPAPFDGRPAPSLFRPVERKFPVSPSDVVHAAAFLILQPGAA
jgi:hypothetical protein